jgi:hypothetical protein
MSLIATLTRRLRHCGRLLTEPGYRRQVREERRLRGLPRCTPTEATLLGRRVRILDALSFVYQREEIFTQEIYRFPCDHDAPFILDGGSNIGLATIYFKQLYPRATVVGFEPDPKACAALRANLAAFGLGDVEAHAAALWKEAGTLPFLPDDADGGRVVATGPARSRGRVATTSRTGWRGPACTGHSRGRKRCWTCAVSTSMETGRRSSSSASSEKPSVYTPIARSSKRSSGRWLFERRSGYAHIK